MSSNLPDDDESAGIQHFIGHPERGSAVSHYFRQVAISRRRQASWINQSWRRNRKLISDRTTWKS